MRKIWINEDAKRMVQEIHDELAWADSVPFDKRDHTKFRVLTLLEAITLSDLALLAVVNEDVLTKLPE